MVTDPATGEVSCLSCGYVVVERGLDSIPDWARDEEGGGEEEVWTVVVNNVS